MYVYGNIILYKVYVAENAGWVISFCGSGLSSNLSTDYGYNYNVEWVIVYLNAILYYT